MEQQYSRRYILGYAATLMGAAITMFGPSMAAYAGNQNDDIQVAEAVSNIKISDKAKESGITLDLFVKVQKSKGVTKIDDLKNVYYAFSKDGNLDNAVVRNFYEVNREVEVLGVPSFPIGEPLEVPGGGGLSLSPDLKKYVAAFGGNYDLEKGLNDEQFHDLAIRIIGGDFAEEELKIANPKVNIFYKNKSGELIKIDHGMGLARKDAITLADLVEDYTLTHEGKQAEDSGNFSQPSPLNIMMEEIDSQNQKSESNTSEDGDAGGGGGQ